MKSSLLRLVLTGLAFAIASAFAAGRAGHLLNLQQQPTSAAETSTTASPTESAGKRVTAYTLSPDLYRKAHNLGKISFWGQLLTFFYSLVVLLLLLKRRAASKIRDWTEKATSVRFLQAVIFAPLFFLTLDVLMLPTSIVRQWVLREYRLSVQGWGSWFWDWTKGEFVTYIVAIILVWVLYSAIRKSPRRWWFYFWVVAVPLGIFYFFLEPWFIDPLFFKFEPLVQKDAPLTASLEQMVQRAGENIPQDRMYWMGASTKLTALNAYVTGIGASKRVVVWDTTIQKMTTPQIVYVAGHETGHYILQHIWKGIAFYGALVFIFFYLVFRMIGWVLERKGAGWGIRGVDDWASLPALLLLLSILFFVANPIANGYSRYLEHQADRYGLEVTHGLTADSGQIGAQSFQVLGEVDLADPEPNPVDIFLFYDHPPIPDRVRFALTYDPWSHGGRGEFVK